MAKRESRRKRHDWLVSVIVIATVALLVLVSTQNGGDLILRVSQFKDNIIRELWSDEPTLAVSAPKIDPVGDGKIRVHFIDVGQGKSILIETPEQTVLIDAGENNQGETVLLYLANRGITKLDIVIGTHPHSDHIGGLDTVMRATEVGKVILPAIPEALSPTTPTYMDVLTEIAAKNLTITVAKAGDVYNLGGGASLKILAPLRNDYSDLNDFSIVSRLAFGSNSFLFTGDATSKAEADLLESGGRLRSDVLDIGHHGSRESSSEAFLEVVRPRIAVISCAVDNSYGHPHRQVIQRLASLGSAKTTLRTDLDGSVVITSNGSSLSYETKNQQERAG